MEITFKSYKFLYYKDISSDVFVSYYSAIELANLDLELKSSLSFTVGLNLALYNYSFCYTGSSIHKYFINSQ